MELAESGRRFWLEALLDDYDYVFMLPHTDNGLNGRFLSALEQKLSKSGSNPKLIILGLDARDDCDFYVYKQINIEVVENILALFDLYRFTDKLIIGSFVEPFGRKLRNLLKTGVVSEDDLIDIILAAIN